MKKQLPDLHAAAHSLRKSLEEIRNEIKLYTNRLPLLHEQAERITNALALIEAPTDATPVVATAPRTLKRTENDELLLPLVHRMVDFLERGPQRASDIYDYLVKMQIMKAIPTPSPARSFAIMLTHATKSDPEACAKLAYDRSTKRYSVAKKVAA